MKKLNLETKNLAKDKFIKLAELFSQCYNRDLVGQDEDGNNIIDRAIDADVLRQEIAEHVIEEEERYEFTWQIRESPCYLLTLLSIKPKANQRG